MRAILSGQAGVALLGDGGKVWSVTVEAPDERRACAWDDAIYLFADASDVVELADVTSTEAQDELERAWRRDRALQLTLILLDHEEEAELRVMAAECVEEHVAFEEVRQFVANRLYSAPLPSTADLPGAKRCAREASAERVAELLDEVGGDQSAIAAVRRSWQQLQADTFGGNDQKSRFEQVAVAAGAFRRFTESIAAGQVEKAWLECMEDARLTALPQYRDVLAAWARPLRSPKDHRDFSEPEHQEKDPSERAHKTRGRHRKSKDVKEPPIHELWTRVEREINVILVDIDEGRQNRALKYAQELVERQKREGYEEFAVKTLCHLAKQMKDRSFYDLQFHFARWAAEDFRTDAQAQTQLADAYLFAGRLSEALSQYDDTITRFPNDEVARNGRAEVLRELGRLDEALIQYDETIAQFPNNEVAPCGRAEVLRELGRSDEALSQYKETIGAFPNNDVAFCGRAEVLRELGRFDEALSQYDETIAQFPNKRVAHCGRAEVLRELGRLDEALSQYDETIARFPNTEVAYCGRAEVLRELGRLDEALSQYKETIGAFPNNDVAFCGRAEVLRELDRLEEALSQYDETIAQFPTNKVARNGCAVVLRELGRFDEALSQYDETIGRFPNDDFARNGRAEASRELGRLDEALNQYDETIDRFPNSVVAFCGRAEVLRELGRLDEALSQYDETVARFPNKRVAYCGRAEVLRELGRLDEALRRYNETIAQFPNDGVAFCGRAEVLRELGRLDEALRRYDETIAQFPNRRVAYCGRAEVLRELGHLDEALRQYEDTTERFPRSRIALRGEANVLIALKRFAEALSLLPELPPETRDDWIDMHVRGMIRLRQGDHSCAIEIFERGVRECPFVSEVSYFRSALAVAQLRMRRYDDVESTLANVTSDVADALRLHAAGEQRQTDKARAVHQRLRHTERRQVIQLRDELAAAYVLPQSPPTAQTAEWHRRIHDQECELVTMRIAV